MAHPGLFDQSLKFTVEILFGECAQIVRGTALFVEVLGAPQDCLQDSLFNDRPWLGCYKLVKEHLSNSPLAAGHFEKVSDQLGQIGLFDFATYSLLAESFLYVAWHLLFLGHDFTSTDE